jgi:hypothetical protein
MVRFHMMMPRSLQHGGLTATALPLAFSEGRSLMYLALRDRDAESVELYASRRKSPLTVAELETLLSCAPVKDGEVTSGSPSFSSTLVESGGEAHVRLIADTVLRFEKRLITPDASEDVRGGFLGKLRAIKPLLPKDMGAVIPEKIIYVGDFVVGHTQKYVANFKPLRVSSMGDAFGTVSPEIAMRVLLTLHAYIGACHAAGLIIGEVNPQNFGFSNSGFVAIDTLAYSVPGFECRTMFKQTVDPLVLEDPALSKAWRRIRPYSPDSDWFSFACIVCELLTGHGPWAGIHKDEFECPELGQQLVRASRGLSIFDPSIEASWGEGKRNPKLLGTQLYNHLYEVFNRQKRGPFPASLLCGLRFKSCQKCRQACAISSHHVGS